MLDEVNCDIEERSQLQKQQLFIFYNLHVIQLAIG